MARASQQAASPEKSILCALLPEDDIAVVRTIGRGNFLNSVPLKQFADHLHAQGRPRQFVLDLAECETLDSTFMGVLAAMSLAQTRSGRAAVIVTNANEHVRRLLKTLGLTHLLELRDGGSSSDAIRKAEGHMTPAETHPVSRLEQIFHTLEAHKTLIKVDDGNELRFQSVVHYLEKSLENPEETGE